MATVMVVAKQAGEDGAWSRLERGNLKPARALGMTTIKVDDPDAALRELGALLGLDLVG